MARCDEGYLCEVCGEDVGSITDSARSASSAKSVTKIVAPIGRNTSRKI